MRMVIRWLSGAVRAGMLVAFKDDALRIAMAGFEDVVELRWRNYGWADVDGEPVTIDFDPSPEVFESARRYFGDPNAPETLPSATSGANPPYAGWWAPQYIN